MEGSLRTAFGDCSFAKRQSYIVSGCNGAHQGDDCGICVCAHPELIHLLGSESITVTRTSWIMQKFVISLLFCSSRTAF